ncbi:MAG: fumarylacetoacetate hydrolase family protein [Pseudomonadota bacterium]
MTAPLFDLAPRPVVPVKGSDRGFPINRIFCVGRNYAAHAAEMGVEVDREAPFYFTKSAAHTVMSGAAVPYPPGTDNYHFEMEFAVAIGAPAFRVAPGDAMAAVFGYCCALDMTRRDLQIKERNIKRPWDLGKDVEGSAVVAPITRAAEFGAIDAQTIWLDQNGTRVQKSTLDLLIHSVPAVIAHLSGFYHLVPGDLILTGTPEGVGPVAPADVLAGGVTGLDPIGLTITAPT